MNQCDINNFKNTIKEFSEKFYIDCCTIVPFGTSGKTLAIYGKQNILEPKLNELKEYVTAYNSNLIYSGIIYDFQINDNPLMMIVGFDIKE